VSEDAPGDVRVLVFGDHPGDRYRAGRTVRALCAAAAVIEEVLDPSPVALGQAFSRCRGAVWLVRAGAWPAHAGPLTFPARSVTGLALYAFGAIRAEAGSDTAPDEAARQWAALQAETGGDLLRATDLAARLPPVASVYLEAAAAAGLAARLKGGEVLSEAFQAEIASGRHRAVRYTPLDVYHDSSLRVAQVVTSLQQGGAERIALYLAQRTSGRGVRPLLISLGRPTRTPFAMTAGTVDLSTIKGDRRRRAEAIAQVVRSFAADLVHGHLLDGEDVARLSALGLPVVVTIHNARPGWPRGLEALRAGDAAFLFACSRAAEADLARGAIPVPVRSVWNGVDFAPFQRTPELLEAARVFRERLGIAPEDFVLLAVANPRPQKRLDLLPAVLAATQAELARRHIERTARLLIAGEAGEGNEAATRAEAAVRAETARLGLTAHVHWLGSVDPIATALVAADVLVSASAYEGLSLAHLEALAAAIPVVATDAGGTAEVAKDNPAVFLVPVDATADRFAQILAEIAQAPPPSGRSAAALHFTRWRMAERYDQLYPRAIEASRGRRQGSGLLLVINNFVTGGAQSSARRLLLGLAAEGVRVRAAVLEEQAARPTPGCRTLTDAGVPVLVVPPAGTIDPARAVADLLEQIDADPPEAIVFWNVIAEYKLLLADALLDIPVYDVSPGEMYFTSLEQYFSRSRPGLPYRSGAEYGARLAGVVVKYQAEAARAARMLRTTVHVIPNGVPLGPAPSRDRSAHERFVVGTAARISPQKKLEELLAALRLADGQMPPYILRIAGGADRNCAAYAEKLRELADGLPVEWVGELDDPRPFLRSLDLFALVAEPAGCPNASLEAMAEGVVVVATDVGGASEQVEDGVSGRLVPRGDARALSEAISELARDTTCRSEWGAAGRARAEAYFDQRRMVADYRRLCLRRGSGAVFEGK
jgi:glycosyltransferase involved in cell wall biosynthesis